MNLVLAHLGHWYEQVLFAVPMAVIGGVLWRSSRRDRLEPGADDDWDGEDEWRDPRLTDEDDDADRF